MSDHTNKVEIIDIDYTGEGYVMPGRLGPELDGWQIIRVEYGGCNEDCLYEGRLLIPPNTDPQAVVNLLKGMAVDSAEWITHKTGGARG